MAKTKVKAKQPKVNAVVSIAYNKLVVSIAYNKLDEIAQLIEDFEVWYHENDQELNEVSYALLTASRDIIDHIMAHLADEIDDPV